jgi:hypothetical protein
VLTLIRSSRRRGRRRRRFPIAFERKKQPAKLRVKAEKTAEEKLGSELEITEELCFRVASVLCNT